MCAIVLRLCPTCKEKLSQTYELNQKDFEGECSCQFCGAPGKAYEKKNEAARAKSAARRNDTRAYYREQWRDW